jgi:hypothetical protein
MHLPVRLLLLGSFLLCSGALARADAGEGPAAPPAAQPNAGGTIDVSTSMPVKDHHLPKLAFDGSASTYFLTRGGVKAGDDLTVALPADLHVIGISVSTGTPDHQYQLAHGELALSHDGAAFQTAVPFTDGHATVSSIEGSVRALRILVTEADSSPLAINEITLAGVARLPPIRFRTRFLVDYHDAPEAKPFAETCKSLCEEWYPTFTDMFDTPEAPPQRSVVRLLFDLNKGVAYATTAGDGISEIHVSKLWAVQHPDDTALIIHESFHIVQGYSGVSGHDHLGWLTEGLADYVRNRLFMPVEIKPDPNKAKYTDAYKTTAAFLMWLEDHKKKGICFKLNAAMRIPNS